MKCLLPSPSETSVCPIQLNSNLGWGGEGAGGGKSSLGQVYPFTQLFLESLTGVCGTAHKKLNTDPYIHSYLGSKCVL